MTRVTALPDFVATAARNHPSRIALTFQGGQWSYAELHQLAGQAATVIEEVMGANQPGARVGILSANRPGVVFAVHGAARTGRAVLPINWRQTASEIRWQLETARVGALLVDEERLDVASVACKGLPIARVPIAEIEVPGAHASERGMPPPIILDREATVIFTSGTSGRPKGARLTFGNFWFSAVASSLHLGHRGNDGWLAVLPLHHVGGLSIVYRAAIGGTRVALHPRFEVSEVKQSLAGGLSLASMVPTMLARLLEDEADATWAVTVRALLLGGAPAPPSLIERCLQLGIPIAPTYGLTETAAQVATLPPGIVGEKIGSSGLPLPVTQLRVTEGSQALAPNQVGEIEVRSPTVFAGYLAEENSAIDAEGWFATGDAGYLDEDGYLFVVDRRQDLIISGGENVYPAEVERVLATHPEVVDVGVVGVTSNEWGARPVAAVVVKGAPDSGLEERLLTHCRAVLAPFKVPERILLVEELPRSPGGKLRRRALHERIAARLDARPGIED